MNLSESYKKRIQELAGLKGRITVFHGTMPKKVDSIKQNGLQAPSSMGYDSAGWYMVSTDFASALFHANIEKGEKAPVFEFEVPCEGYFKSPENIKWEGYPYFWPPYERSAESKWFALKQPIPSGMIKKIHYINYDEWIQRKINRF